jgi:squalene-hopene/tetraprenyl-beta-curcumene cyclase
LNWLRVCQNPDGGWGESQGSYEDPALKGMGKSTASQTAWALMVYFALEAYDCPEVERGLRYLLRCQLVDGSWRDEYWTATGFPKVFYLNYHLYASCFSLLALSVYLYRGRTQVAAAPPGRTDTRIVATEDDPESSAVPDAVGAGLLRARRV